MIVDFFKGMLIGKVTQLIEFSVVIIFVVGFFAFPIVLFVYELPAFIIVPLYMVFLYFWLGSWLKRAQEKAKTFSASAARWIREN